MPPQTATPAAPAPRKATSRLPDVRPPVFRNAYEERAWQQEREELQAKLSDAWSSCPPGSVFYVSLVNGHPTKTRSRSGLVFTKEHRSKVEVSDLAADDLAALVRAGAYLVTPEGAAAILADTSLQVAATATVGADLETANELADTKAKLAAATAELDALRGGKAPKAPKEGALDTRSARAQAAEGGTPGAVQPASDDFGKSPPKA